MYSIKRRIKGKNRTFKIWTAKEFAQWHPDKPLFHWKESIEPGSYLRTDDGYVCELIRVLGPYDGDEYQLVLPFARPWRNRTKELNFEEYYGKGNYSQPKGTWLDNELQKPRTKRVIRLYAMILLKKGRVTREDQIKLANLYRPDQEQPIATFKRILKQKKTRDMIDEQLQQLLLDSGITQQDVINRYKETYDTARTAEHTATMKSVTDKFAELLGMTGKKPSGPPSGKELEAGESEIMGLLQQTEEFIEAPDDDAYIEEIPAKHVE